MVMKLLNTHSTAGVVAVVEGVDGQLRSDQEVKGAAANLFSGCHDASV